MEITTFADSAELTKASNRTQKIVPDRRLKLLRRLHVLAITVLPALGTVWALLDLRYHSVSFVDLFLLVGMFFLTAIGIEVGYHRYFSHRSFQAKQGTSIALAILGSMAAQGPVTYWVGLHRRHHEYSDQPNDPHSPNLHGSRWIDTLQGFWHSHIGWMFNHDIPNPMFYSPELLRDGALAKVSQLYFVWLALGLLIPFVLGGMLTGTLSGAWSGFLWGGAVRLFIGENLIWTINSVVHMVGQRPFKTRDSSRNCFWLAIPTLGGAWHNNHHAFPNSAITGLYWWQMDLGGELIRCLAFLGLAWDVKIPTQRMIKARAQVDPVPL